MSVELVGKELLPNTYIKNISLYDHSDTHEICVVDVCVLDMSENSLWSEDDLLLKNMSVAFVASENGPYNDAITNNVADLSEKSVNSFINENLSYQGTDLFLQKKRLASAKIIVRDGIKYFNHKFEFVTLKNKLDTSKGLKIYAATLIDSKNMSQNYNLDLLSDQVSTFMGPISSESVYNNGQLQEYTRVFIKPNGQQYVGPVHVHNNVFMEGSKHSNSPHDTLIARQIHNQKIKDFRQYPFMKKNQIPAAAFSRSKVFFSKLYNTFDHKEGSFVSTFAVNLFNIFLNKTMYGKLLYKATPTMLEEIYNNFSFENFFIQRQKVEVTPTGINVIEKTNLTHLSITGPVNQLPNDFTSMSYVDNQSGVTYYEFRDKELNNKKPGFYKYKLFYSMNDPTVSFVEGAISELRSGISAMKDYFAQLSRIPHFDREMNKTTELFMQFVNTSYSADNFSNAPFITAMETFIKYKSFLYNIDNMKLIKNSIRNRINPKTATIETVRHFVDEYEFLLFEFQNQFNFDTSEIKDMQALPVLKHRKNGILIELEHEFEDVFHPMANKTHYNFLKLPDDSPGPLAKVTREQVLERITKENNKFDGNISVEITSDVYLSPAEAKADKIKVDLEKISAIDASSLAEIFIERDSEDLFLRTISSEDPEESTEADITAPAPLSVRMPMIMAASPATAISTTSTLTTLGVAPVGASLENVMITPDNLSSITANIQTISEVVCEDNRDESIQTAFESFRNMVLKDGTDDFLIKASKFLKSQSNFLDFTQRIENCTLPQDVYGGFLEKRLFLDSLLPERKNSLFDIKNAKSYLNDTSRTGTSTSLDSLPSQVKSVFELPNIDSTDDIDLSKFKLVREVNHFSLVRILVFRGFRSDPLFPMIKHLNQHVWTPIKLEDLNNSSGQLLCVMKYYAKAALDIQVKSLTKLPIANKYFVISDAAYSPDVDGIGETGAVSSGGNTVLASPLEDLLGQEISRFRNSMNYNYDYSTSNIVESPPDTETTWHGGFALSSTEESVLNGEQINTTLGPSPTSPQGPRPSAFEVSPSNQPSGLTMDNPSGTASTQGAATAYSTGGSSGGGMGSSGGGGSSGGSSGGGGGGY